MSVAFLHGLNSIKNVEGEISGINGVVEEYVVNAGATVSAGDFVEFVSKWGNGQFYNSPVSYVSACKIDDSRVLVAFNTSSQGKMCVIKIKDSSITIGPTALFYSTEATTYTSVVVLSESRAIIAAKNYTNYLWYCPVEIFDDMKLSQMSGSLSDSSIHGDISVVKLSDNKAVVTWVSGGMSTYAKVLTITGATITEGNSKLISYNTDALSSVAMSSDKVLVSLFSTGVEASYVIVLTVSGMNITVGTPKAFASMRTTSKAVMLTENKGLIVHYYSSTRTGYLKLFTVEGASVIISDKITSFYHDTDYHIDHMAVVALSENKVIVTYQDQGNSKYGTAVLITIDGDDVTAGEPVVFDYNATDYNAIVAFSPESALVVYNNGVGSFSTIGIDGDTITSAGATQGVYVQPATSRLHNVGIAKTGGSEGETVEVYCVNNV